MFGNVKYFDQSPVLNPVVKKEMCKEIMYFHYYILLSPITRTPVTGAMELNPSLVINLSNICSVVENRIKTNILFSVLLKWRLPSAFISVYRVITILVDTFLVSITTYIYPICRIYAPE